MNNEIVLIICEGEKREKALFENIKTIFYKERKIEFFPYCTNIYQLYAKLKEDDFETELYDVLLEKAKERGREAELLQIDRKKISSIYLFFDYDGHDPNATDDKLKEMLEHFDNETEMGKLYINYPMVESLRHLKNREDCSRNCCIDAKTNVHYKNISSDGDYNDISCYTKESWYRFMHHNVCKSNCLLNGTFTYPQFQVYEKEFLQGQIFAQQLEKCIFPYKKVMILNTIPLFLLDDFGKMLYMEVLEYGKSLIYEKKADFCLLHQQSARHTTHI